MSDPLISAEAVRPGVTPSVQQGLEIIRELPARTTMPLAPCVPSRSSQAWLDTQLRLKARLSS